MFGHLDKYILVFLTGLVVTYLLTPVVRRLALRFGIVDLPNARRPHKRPTARGGGLAVVLGAHAAILMAVAFPWPNLAGGLDFHWWQHFALASLVLLAVGLVDDIRGLSPLVKLAGQVLAAGLVCLSGTRFGSFMGMELPPLLDYALVVVWLVAVINAFNLIDGLDGLASGLAIISAVGLCGVFVLQQLPVNVLVLLGLIGACLAFLRYNFHPASIFLGDTGSMFIGFILGVISLQTLTKNTFLLSLTIPMLVVGVPIYDALLAIWRRSVRLWLSGQRGPGAPKARGIMQADVEHIHHRLLQAGLGTRRVATILCVLNGALVGFGLLMMMFQSRAAGIFLIALLAGVYLLMRHLAVIELRETGGAILSGLRRPSHSALKSMTYQVWDMAWLAGSVAFSMWFMEEARVAFWHNWFLELPIWVTPTFCLLAMSRVYLTVWTRAQMVDVLVLVSLLVLGLLLSLGIAMLMDPANATVWALRAFRMGAISHPAILLARVFYRSIEETVVFLRNRSEGKPDSERVILYGAGARSRVFLKERGYTNARAFDGRVIVGFVDDEPLLQGQWVYGYLVLGRGNDLLRLVPRHQVTRILITAELKPEKRAVLEEIVSRLGMHLSEWSSAEHEIPVEAAQAAPAAAEAVATIPTPAPAPDSTSPSGLTVKPVVLGSS